MSCHLKPNKKGRIPMKKPSILKRQDGFTLIEIIAVLVLLGILAAVAVPKYINLQQEAELKSVEGVRAELTSRANQYYAQYLLDPTSTTQQNNQDLDAWVNPAIDDIGSDFTLSNNGGTLVVTVASGNSYNMTFSAGTNATDGTGGPAEFGPPQAPTP
jgi:MSHA pilin protein MshA